MPSTGRHATAIETRGAVAPTKRPALRKTLKSAGVLGVAAAFIGSLALPAAAFQGSTQESYSAESLAALVAENSQAVTVAQSAQVDEVAVNGLEATSPEELEEIRAAAADAEAQRQEELAAQAAAAQAASQQNASVADNVEAADSASSSAAAVVAAPVESAGNGSIVSIAQSQLGVPYVWGGTSPSTGFDCSGFTMWVYAQIGVSLPHSSNAQGGYGTQVSAPSPGDLIVWSGHVAIYAGNDQIIHAATSGKPVKYSSYSGMVAAFGTPNIRHF